MTQPQPEKPQTWMPLIVAGSVALLVVIGAVVVHMVRADLSPQKRAAADACGAQYERQFPEGPGITGGDIFAAREWRDRDARMVALGLAQDVELTGEEADARDDEAAALVSAGGERMTVIWQLDDETHAQCVAQLKDGTVTGVTVTTLAAGTTATPTPTPKETS